MENTWKGIHREKIPWYPTIDSGKCVNCGICLDFCTHNTYENDKSTGKVIVKNPYNCVVGCSSCKAECPNEAILFPSLEILKEFIQE